MAPRQPSKATVVRKEKPLKPKRAPTGYNIFMKKFMKSQCISSREDAKNAIKAGAKLWGKMSSTEKEKYVKESSKLRVKYDEAMTSYRRQVQALKAPPRPFAAFVRDYYNGDEFDVSLNESSQDTIARLSRSASRAWHKLANNQRVEYTRHFQAQYQQHKLRLSGSAEEVMEVDDTPPLAPQVQGPSVSSRRNQSRNTNQTPCMRETPVSPPSVKLPTAPRKSSRIRTRKSTLRN